MMLQSRKEQQMSRGGRPRKTGVDRGAGGRIKASVYRDIRKLAVEELKKDQLEMARWQYANNEVFSNGTNPAQRSMLGRMFHSGHRARIDVQMYTAGQRVRDILHIYDTKVLRVSRSAQAQNIARERGRALGDENVESVERAANEYAKLLTILGSHKARVFDPDGEIVVDRPGMLANATFVVCRDQGDETHGTDQEIALAVEGLKRLVEHWGLRDNETRRIKRWNDADTRAARVARVMVPPEAFTVTEHDDD